MKLKVQILSLFLICMLANQAFAQDLELTDVEKLEQRSESLEDAVISLKKLKVSGYIQAQYQSAEKNANTVKVGGANQDMEKSFNRIGIRRGRIKFTYEEGIYSGVFQLDLTEKKDGAAYFKDVYLNVKDPWNGTSALRAGIFDRPFGYEISYSSSRRESPERATIFQTLFPDERDLGGMLVLQAAKTSALNFIKLEAGLFSGNGIRMDIHNNKDFIGHLSMSNTIGSEIKFGLGASYYNGGVFQGNENVYKMEGAKFVLDNNVDNKGKLAKREYIGFDGQLSHISNSIGMTQLRAEFLLGKQPAAKGNSKSPNASALPSGDTYIRNFKGGYVILVQDFGTLPFSAIVKYDWYDPNTKVSKSEVGASGSGTGVADLAQNTVGLGALWRVSNSLRLQAYYEINKYEKTEMKDVKVNGATTDDFKGNVFTLRLQYKF